MQTLATARQEKTTENIIAQRQLKAKIEKIEFLEGQIELEKEAIKECVDAEMFSFIAGHVSKIEKLQIEVFYLRS